MYFQLKPNVTCILMGFIYPIKVLTVMNASDGAMKCDSVCIAVPYYIRLLTFLN